MNNEEDPFKGLEDYDVEEDPVQTVGAYLSILKERFADQIDDDISLDEYVDLDIEVSATHGKLKCWNVRWINRNQRRHLWQRRKRQYRARTNHQSRGRRSAIEDFSLYSKFEEAIMRSLKELNFNVEKEYVFNKKQTLISDFFLKQ